MFLALTFPDQLSEHLSRGRSCSRFAELRADGWGFEMEGVQRGGSSMTGSIFNEHERRLV